ncbi:DUF1796 family putative cysteine peptidase [Bacillus wiedmannii]|uniref:DUF1796 family putative cysteine peptidase n=1 Tax=Bacillus wiedmannii TaxID=1890302 RepID=UPI000BECA6B2|nr:DUF1796 family putative cysteine peptidase [Bacillus wiedmannii]PEF43388.1 peptidase [Bacillus wiedmannii]
MKLIDIQQDYDAIFSLGNQCFVANKLRRYNLRKYAGVIDWMISLSLQSVTKLLQNRFEGFMEKENMIFSGYHDYGRKLLLKDTKYNIDSAHDFLVTENTSENWPTYLNFKIKIDRRIQRFLNKLNICNNILFIRIGGTYEEVKLLEKVLFETVKGNFQVLLLNSISEYKIVEYNWDLQYTCSIGIPMDGNENHEIWDQIFKNITHKED